MGLESVHVERVLPRLTLWWRHVVALQPPGPAAYDAAPAVALEDGAADNGPTPGVQVGVAVAQIFCYGISFQEAGLGSVRYSPIRSRTM